MITIVVVRRSCVVHTMTCTPFHIHVHIATVRLTLHTCTCSGIFAQSLDGWSKVGGTFIVHIFLFKHVDCTALAIPQTHTVQHFAYNA